MASGYGTDSNGAVLTSEEVQSFVVEPLLAEAVVLSAGPKVFRTKGVPLHIPRIDALNLSNPWVAENTLIPEADPTWGEVTLLPSSLKGLKVIHRVSAELVRHAVGDVTNVMSLALVKRIANAIDRAFLLGDGTSGTILGISNASGVQVVSTVGSLTVDDLHDMVGLALSADAKPTTWFMPPRDLISLRKLKTTDGQYLVTPDPTEANAYKMIGLPVKTTTQIPSNGGAGTNESTIVLADMDQVAVGIDEEITTAILTERYADYDQVGVKVTGRFDIAPLNPKGVVVARGVTA